jgi:hypothetical protein
MPGEVIPSRLSDFQKLVMATAGARPTRLPDIGRADTPARETD